MSVRKSVTAAINKELRDKSIARDITKMIDRELHRNKS